MPEITASIDLVVVTLAREEVVLAIAISIELVLAIAREVPAIHLQVTKDYCRGSAERSFPLIFLLKWINNQWLLTLIGAQEGANILPLAPGPFLILLLMHIL